VGGGRTTADTVSGAGGSGMSGVEQAISTCGDQIAGSGVVLLPRAGHLLPDLHAGRLAEIILGAGVPVG